MKKIIIMLLFLVPLQISAITSYMSHRVMGTNILLYKMIDYSKHEISFEAEPIFMSMYENEQVISNIMPSGKATLEFDQQGRGDFNPLWINLMSSNNSADYNSKVTFTPSLTQSGMLLHWYDNFEHMFIDIKTALVQCKSEIEINEIGGDNGLISGILNAQQAFSQADWNYGKIGQANHVVGLDNIEIRFGGVTQATSNASTYDLFITGFGLIEAPTGTGTKAEWLFEPQVGTNHWGLGFGFEALLCGDDDLKFMIAGNYRYLVPAWETRSFDLLDNGPWSRYLGIQDTYGLPIAPTTLPLPGINFFTQQAYIKGRSELNLYFRLSKQIRSSYFELGYNFFCLQQESIGTIKNPTPTYGIYALTGPAGGSGGVTTASRATINEDVTNFDPIGSPVIITTDSFNKASAAQGTFVTNTLAARFEILRNNIVYGFGAALDAGLSNNAISTWSVWAKFEYRFDNVMSNECHHEYSPRMYDINPMTGEIEHYEQEITDTNFPQDLVDSIEEEILENIESFDFSELENEDSEIFDDEQTPDEIEENIEQEIVFENQPEEQDDMDELREEKENIQQEYSDEDAKISQPSNIEEETVDIETYENLPTVTIRENGLLLNTGQAISTENHDVIPANEGGLQLFEHQEPIVENNVPENLTIELAKQEQARQLNKKEYENNVTIPVEIDETSPAANIIVIDSQAQNNFPKKEAIAAQTIAVDIEEPAATKDTTNNETIEIVTNNEANETAEVTQQPQEEKSISEQEILEQLDSSK